MPRTPELHRLDGVTAELARMKRMFLPKLQKHRLEAIRLRYEERAQWKQIAQAVPLTIDTLKVCVAEAVKLGVDYAVLGHSLRHGRRRGYSDGNFPFKSTYQELQFWKKLKNDKVSVPDVREWARREYGVDMKEQFIYHYRRKYMRHEDPPPYCTAVDQFLDLSSESHLLWKRTEVLLWKEIIGYYLMNWRNSRASLCSFIIRKRKSPTKWWASSKDWKKAMADRGKCYVSAVLELCSQAIGDDECHAILGSFNNASELALPGRSSIFDLSTSPTTMFWKISATWRGHGHGIILIPYKEAPDRAVYLLGRYLVRKSDALPARTNSTDGLVKEAIRAIDNLNKRRNSRDHRAIKDSEVLVLLDCEEEAQRISSRLRLSGKRGFRVKRVEPSNHFAHVIDEVDNIKWR